MWDNYGSIFYDTETVVLKLGSDTLRLDLSGNLLTGTIPVELVQLLDVATSFVDLRGNPLTGTLPQQFCPWLCGKEVKSSQTLLVDCETVACNCDC